MKLKDIVNEIVLHEPPNDASIIEFPMADKVSDFRHSIKDFTVKAKEQFENEVLSKIKGKDVTIVGSRGYKQPKKEYSFTVSAASIDWYYEKYFVVLKDEENQDHFVEDGTNIQVFGDTDKPMTAITQNKPQSNGSIHSIKQV